MAFRRVASLDELWSGERLALKVEGKPLLLIREGDEVRAFADRCAHLGLRMSEGCLAKEVLTCSAHGWQYDARTGAGLNPKGVRLKSYPVKLEGGGIFVDLRESEVDRQVGPVLQSGQATDAILEAIRDGNRNVTWMDRGGYLRVLVPRRCVLSRKAVESLTGRPFHLPGDLEAVMSSFMGKLTVTEQEAVWEDLGEGR